jgi:hypothetical protein
MAKIRIEQLSRLIELLCEEIEVKLEQPLLLRDFLERNAGSRQDIREGLYLDDKLNPDIFIVEGVKPASVSSRGSMRPSLKILMRYLSTRPVPVGEVFSSLPCFYSVALWYHVPKEVSV